MAIDRFPPTRYQGSKRKLLGFLWDSVRHLDFHSCLDLFSGSACVSYLLKVQGKRVTSNDALRANQVIAQALVENPGGVLPVEEARRLWAEPLERRGFIAEAYRGLYYLEEENQWLDTVAARIHRDLAPPQRQLALYALYQAALIKRPYNLFHRANLAMRTREVRRSFGNKASWDRPFAEHFERALEQANGAVFDDGQAHQALCGDFRAVPGSYDLVYADPPYLSQRGAAVDYAGFYHFLEGLTDYAGWPERVDGRYRHRPYRGGAGPSPFLRRETILGAFDQIFERYRDALLVVSYRSDGVPAVEELVRRLRHHGRKRVEVRTAPYRYALSPGAARAPAGRAECLLVCE